MSNYVYIAASLDGFIARADGSLDWLTELDNPEQTDYGYNDFISRIDAIVMGRGTYETVSRFATWPYTKPVFVLSSTLNPENPPGAKITVTALAPSELVKELDARGYHHLYIDGGKTIQSFLACDLIDELIITRVPVLLGTGIPLFGALAHELAFKHLETVVYKNGLVKSRYLRG